MNLDILSASLGFICALVIVAIVYFAYKYGQESAIKKKEK